MKKEGAQDLIFKALKNHNTLEYLLNGRNLKREDLSHPMRLMTRTLTFS
jgi:hypothetical protein